MLVSVVAIAALTVDTNDVTLFLGPGGSLNRPISTIAPYPPGMADSVRRPGFNGRLWVSRPVIGGLEGPYPLGWGPPGPEAYGAFDNQWASVPARVGLLVVDITPWQSINSEGLHRLENARQFWLQEQGYTGGVRTFVNDLYVWKPDAASPAQHADASETPAPRATIQLPADMPRQRRRIRVDAGDAGRPERIACPGAGPMRVSWPETAPADAVARTLASGGFIDPQPAPRVITAAAR